MRILTVQMNPTIGDLKGNTSKIIQSIEKGRQQNVDIVLFPELALTGYPPEDLLLLPNFMDSVEAALEVIIKASEGVAVIVGLPRRHHLPFEKKLHNSAAIIYNQHLVDYVDKRLLPTYDVFDERRFFEPGTKAKIWSFKGEKIGITICEDAWQHSGLLESVSYPHDPIKDLQTHSLSCMLNLSASPFSLGKFKSRLKVFLNASQTLKCPVVMCNQVGANDSLIFDGYSLYVNQGNVVLCAKGFVEDELVVDLLGHNPLLHIDHHGMNDLYEALVLGIRDYFAKMGFKKACLGLSGGIDSAVVAALAVAALGAENVLVLMMPSRYSSEESLCDAKLLAERLGVKSEKLSIEGPFESYLSLLNPAFEGIPSGIAEENLQARIRGMLLMAFSNKFGHIVLSTGNKSELAMGYSTLYGDMCGGLSVIGDVTKKQVYALAHWINRHEEIIPSYTIERPPSAELRPDQKDSDSLPDYDIVDRVVQAYVEHHESPETIADKYHLPLELVYGLIKRIHANEYKRRQSPPCFRISEKAFSVGRRFPIVQKWT